MSSSALEYKECYVAFLDILGFRELVTRSQDEPELLEQLVLVLNEVATTTSPEAVHRDSTSGELKHWTVQVRAFSDSIFLYIPTESLLLPYFLSAVRRLFYLVLEMGFCLRGGVTIGSMYWSDAWCQSPRRQDTSESEKKNGEVEIYKRFGRTDLPIALGKGLIEAYTLEKSVAVYPRIVIGDKLFTHMTDFENGENQGNPSSFPLCNSTSDGTYPKITEFIRNDFDGVRFLDVLHPRMNHTDIIRKAVAKPSPSETVHSEEINVVTRKQRLKSVRASITRAMASATNSRIRMKYDWFANYFNEMLSRETDEGLSLVEPIPMTAEDSE